MANFKIFLTICAIFVATTLSLPAIDGTAEIENIGTIDISDHKALMTMSEDGNPQLVVVGEDVGRAALGNFLNFTAYLENRTPNTTQISFVPLIAILASLNRGG